MQSLGDALQHVDTAVDDAPLDAGDEGSIHASVNRQFVYRQQPLDAEVSDIPGNDFTRFHARKAPPCGEYFKGIKSSYYTLGLEEIMRIGFVVGVIAAVMASGEARADWQYTKWNMTAEEVVAASNGAAERNERSGKNWGDTNALLQAPYATEKYQFTAYFHFDKKTDRLSRVVLELTDGSKNDLFDNLIEVYGPPIQKDNTLGMVLNWRWLAEKDTVMYRVFKNKRPPDDISVVYEPRAEKKGSGL
jgi:hypothetical protein